MKLNNDLQYLIKLLKLIYPVRIEFTLEAVIYDEVDDQSGSFYLSKEPYAGVVDWEQVIQRYKSDSLLSFKYGEEVVSVSFNIVKLSGIAYREFRLNVHDLYSKAIKYQGTL